MGMGQMIENFKRFGLQLLLVKAIRARHLQKKDRP